MSDVLTINGVSIDLATSNASLDRLVPYRKGGIPELHFSRIVGTPGALPDAWSAKTCTLTMGGTLVFSGDVVGYVDRYMDGGVGWLREYRALGMRNRGDYIPVTDATSLTDTSVWNLPGDDPAFVASRSGLTVGQIVTDLLTMTTNAPALNAAGLGAYTSSSPWTLPTLTVNDLATLTVIPPWRASISGERILQAIESFVTSVHPNHMLWVQPDGTLRFLDIRTFVASTLTIGSDPRLAMPTLTRDYSDCYSQVLVRGSALVVGVTLGLNPWPGSTSADGGMQEDFAWGSYTNAQAIANWTPSDWNQPSITGGQASDYGTCTCPSTTTVTVTSSVSGQTWAADYWGYGAGEAQGEIFVYDDSLGGLIDQVYSARIVSNTALTAGGTSTLTLDRALPYTTYNSYRIFGLSQNASLVGRRFRITNSAIASAIQQYFPYPFAFRTATGNAATVTSTALMSVLYSSSGSPPYEMSTMTMTVDPVAGLIYADRPVQLVFGSPIWPSDVQVFVPVSTGALETYYPSSTTYGGTSYTVEGLQRTKTVTVREWRDSSNSSNMNAYAQNLFGSMSDVVVEGTIPYQGLLSTYLTMGTSGLSVELAGVGFTTGYESTPLPVVGCEVVFNAGPNGTSYTTSLQVSTRRGRFSAEQFIRPSLTILQLGAGDSTPLPGPFAPSGGQTE